MNEIEYGKDWACARDSTYLDELYIIFPYQVVCFIDLVVRKCV